MHFHRQNGRIPERKGSPPSSPDAASPRDRDSRRPLLSRKKLLENGGRLAASTLGFGTWSRGTSRVAGLLAGVPVASGGWGVGLGPGVQSAEAFGGPSRPLNRYGGPARFCSSRTSLYSLGPAWRMVKRLCASMVASGANSLKHSGD